MTTFVKKAQKLAGHMRSRVLFTPREPFATSPPYRAPRPPRSIFRSIAAHLGRKILYVPIGQLSPAKLKRLRVVHVLDSYERRAIAKEYIW